MTFQGRTNWCCDAFKGLFDNGGERAFAILVDRDLDGYAFILQHRALEPGDLGPQDHPSPISAISEMHIRFCPWCGRLLAKFYKQRLKEMVRPGLRIPRP
jgi:hypothetical protein